MWSRPCSLLGNGVLNTPTDSLETMFSVGSVQSGYKGVVGLQNSTGSPDMG
jgi:hypothetical protein